MNFSRLRRASARQALVSTPTNPDDEDDHEVPTDPQIILDSMRGRSTPEDDGDSGGYGAFSTSESASGSGSRFGSVASYEPDPFSAASKHKRPASSLNFASEEETQLRVIKKRRIDDAEEISRRHGLSLEHANELKRIAGGDIMNAVMEGIAWNMKATVSNSDDTLKLAMDTKPFKENLTLRIKAILCYPSLAAYKKKLPDTMLKLCIADPTAWGLPIGFNKNSNHESLITSKLNSSIHTARNTLKTAQITKSIEKKTAIGCLVKACLPPKAAATQPMLARLAFLRYALVDFSSQLAAKSEFKANVAGKDVTYKKDNYWDFVDDSLAQLRKREGEESDEERTARIKETLRDILTSDEDSYTVTEGDLLTFDPMHSWQEKLHNDLAAAP